MSLVFWASDIGHQSGYSEGPFCSHSASQGLHYVKEASSKEKEALTTLLQMNMEMERGSSMQAFYELQCQFGGE